MKIRHKLTTYLKSLFTKDKEEFWLEYYKQVYINHKVAMIWVLLDADYNRFCPKGVSTKLSFWFDDYMNKKYPKLRRPGFSSLRQYIQLKNEIPQRGG